ncbi:GDPGTP exchange factor Sec2p [Cordyceps fumosorosea ARSEF 2679]|uniref:GDPGTP exchange factor Sec2p n=1 Tax=Cordyceps fumosorosea (strain ARSEF 2679) TaxID=1081104 RepID=A0A167LNF7_CORFA|nr:GDPGTP exchange factor Sec2p [Cordyceps fumosorosea ARSEF 2679]OAA53296.1 GDPGTP exchange factor Sec2p [Cordyceps fumosorosea ARSEF 2679]
MESFIHVPGWSQHLSHRPSASRPLSGHFRSLSSVSTTKPAPPSPSPLPQLPLKSPKSTSQLPKISLSPTFLDDEMSTLPDPRSRRVSNAEDQQSEPDAPNHHPDLSDEIATLSTKLINAINHQTALDDTLSATRQELQTAHGRIRELEQQNESQREMLAGDVWIRKSTIESDKRAMKTKFDSEVSKRLETEAEKKRIEQELETLATALFEEANKMVIVAKEESKEREDAVQRKNDLLKAQLEESEVLLKNQQTQLAELKRVMETMSSHDDQQTNTTAPSSPGLPRLDTIAGDRLPPPDSAAASPLPDFFAPAPPTSLQHLILPVLRHDLGAYDDFINLAHQSHKPAGSRISSGSMGGLAALGLGLAGSTSSGHISNASTSSLPNAASAGSGPSSPNTPASSTQGTPNQNLPMPALKETKFYKRVIVEDIEPTLRLDSAPGLSWLARRSVLTAVTDGSLVVEPVPTNVSYAPAARPQLFPCALCGEARKEAQYLRNHRFRTSESPSAQRYPLCKYCLGRVRSTCGFLGFLRMVKDGHWRADDEDHEKTAWEESVRLREQMFWSRIGGGVIPASQAGSPTDEEARASVDGVLSTTLTVPTAAPVNGQASKSASDTKPVFDHKAPAREPRTPPEQTDTPTPTDHYSESPELRKEADNVAAAEKPVAVEN